MEDPQQGCDICRIRRISQRFAEGRSTIWKSRIKSLLRVDHIPQLDGSEKLKKYYSQVDNSTSIELSRKSAPRTLVLRGYSTAYSSAKGDVFEEKNGERIAVKAAHLNRRNELGVNTSVKLRCDTENAAHCTVSSSWGAPKPSCS